ncbi:hypothetical protein C667_01488 [Thauera phenylacetica B4P]|uniref:Uncharacterized protein n=1 Tax=Thauera phenylacetica B4P TaxID=1234382 RepID=N6Z4X6_9RHOO|nr:hypothetical protein C667_01488 [Thauera phenylacetica B4P]
MFDHIPHRDHVKSFIRRQIRHRSTNSLEIRQFSDSLKLKRRIERGDAEAALCRHFGKNSRPSTDIEQFLSRKSELRQKVDLQQSDIAFLFRIEIL